MFKKLKHGMLNSRIFALFSYYIIQLYSRTLRLTIENEALWLDHLEKGGKVVLCTWHQQFFACIRYFQKYSKYKPVIMISRSKEGTFISRIATLSGWEAIRGSSSKKRFSSKGGVSSLKKMTEKMSKNYLGAQIVDGPRGPMGIVKKGILYIARDSGARILPVCIKVDNAWYCKSWDRFVLPKPFSKVTISYGKMIKVSKDSNPILMEEQRKKLEIIMTPALL